LPLWSILYLESLVQQEIQICRENFEADRSVIEDCRCARVPGSILPPHVSNAPCNVRSRQGSAASPARRRYASYAGAVACSVRPSGSRESLWAARRRSSSYTSGRSSSVAFASPRSIAFRMRVTSLMPAPHRSRACDEPILSQTGGDFKALDQENTKANDYTMGSGKWKEEGRGSVSPAFGCVPASHVPYGFTARL
jgi:hypothetical protein